LISTLDGRLLNALQTEFPLVEDPFAALADILGHGPDEVLQQIERLKSEGIIRQIGPVVDGRRLGFTSTLAAMTISAARLVGAEDIIAAQPGVSHGYERDHAYNVWFTLSSSTAGDIEETLAVLKQETGAEIVFSLPAVKMFKLGAYFDVEGEGLKDPVRTVVASGEPLSLSQVEKQVLNVIQQDLPLTSHPFAGMAAEAGLPVSQFLDAGRSLLSKGAIRRFSASINHRRAGFTANAMTCWAVPPELVDTMGSRLAALREVSHCYERATNAYWRHNVFAMIHGHSPETASNIVQQIAQDTGLWDCLLLYSRKEFKKERVKYVL
jgi:DNA-binding Lrp family transcriptional regulator